MWERGDRVRCGCGWWRRKGTRRGNEESEGSSGLGFTAGRGWALEAGPVEKEVARGLAGGLAGLLGSLLPLSYSLETENNKEEKEKKGGVGEEIGHSDNFPGLTKMCLFQENRKGHG